MITSYAAEYVQVFTDSQAFEIFAEYRAVFFDETCAIFICQLNARGQSAYLFYATLRVTRSDSWKWQRRYKFDEFNREFAW